MNVPVSEEFQKIHSPLCPTDILVLYGGETHAFSIHMNTSVRMIGMMSILVSVLVLGGVGYLVWQRQTSQQPTPSTPSLVPTKTIVSRFASGVYYRQPNLTDPSAMLTSLDAHRAMGIQLPPVDFDMNASVVVTANDDTVTLTTPDGQSTTVNVRGLVRIARPSLSPDGTRIAVQASTKKGDDPHDLGIYLVNLADGSVEPVSPVGLGTPAEAPVWFNTIDRLAYSTFSPTTGVNIHVYDVASRTEVMTIPAAGWLHLAISKDDKFLVVPTRMKIFDLGTGKEIADLKEKVMVGLAQTRYGRDRGHPGDLDNFPLDGDFSPDGKQLIFDGAVVQNGVSGMIICRINRDGTGFTVVRDFIPTDPSFTNNNNFSQLNPLWL